MFVIPELSRLRKEDCEFEPAWLHCEMEGKEERKGEREGGREEI
jgi:hypothetical protein